MGIRGNSSISTDISTLPIFSDSVQPTELPICGQAITSVVFESTSAAKIAQCAHDFLIKKVDASVIKVTPEKFSIKAVIFHKVGNCLLNCTLKVRVFQKPLSIGGKQYLVAEFRRRQGDAVVFNHIFDLVSSHLKAHDAPHAGIPSEPIPPYLALPEHADAGGADIQALVGMMANDDCPTVQVEALTVLLVYASAQAAATAISTALACHEDALHGLLSNSRSEVSYAARRLAGQLENPHGTPITF